MQQILNFIIKNKTFLWFLLLFTIAISLTIQSHSYHKSKFINSANFLTGGIYGWRTSVTDYFNLKDENEKNLKAQSTADVSEKKPKTSEKKPKKAPIKKKAKKVSKK